MTTDRPIITLLTDFGVRDTYVGVMKGAILALCPHCQVVDLTHQVEPQNIVGGAFQLARAVGHFPHGTIHLAVVDPGVGSGRQALALATPRGFFVGPDNGLLAGVASDFHEGAVLPLPDQASPTFHGRDLFAPTAARLALGQPLRLLGAAFHGPLVQLPTRRREEVIWVDHFGNLITSLRQAHGSPIAGVGVEVAGRRIPLARTYSDVPSGQLLSLFGSDGYLEIACNGGNAASLLGLGTGTPVRLY